MKCIKCGSELQEGNKICAKCRGGYQEEFFFDYSGYHNKNSVWSPRALKYIAIFCSIIPGAILFSMNYLRLEHQEKKKKILTVITIALVYFLLAFITPNFPFVGYLFMAINIVIATYFSSDQKKLFEHHIKNGGKKASVTIPLILSIVILFLLFLDISYPTFSFVYKRMTLSDKDLINHTFNLTMQYLGMKG